MRAMKLRFIKILFISSLLSACMNLADQLDEPEGVKIHYTEQGSGPAVVLIHGFSQTSDMWQHTPIPEVLATKHRVIAIDCRGHGQSAKPHEPEAYGPKMGEDVIRLLDELEIEKAHLVGFSMGASIVGQLLVTHPERIHTATLGSGFFPSWNEEEEEFARYTEERGKTGDRFPWEPENQDFDALAAVIRGGRFATVTDEDIAQISTPTIAVFGSIELDHFSDDERARLFSAPPSMSLLVIEGADHDEERPAILQPEVLQAVQELIASSGGVGELPE